MRNAQAKNWEKVYWAFDIHGTILKPTFERGVLSTEFYPLAEETMRFISQQQNIIVFFTHVHIPRRSLNI